MQSRGSPSSQRTTNMLSSRTEMMEARYLFVDSCLWYSCVGLRPYTCVGLREAKGGQRRIKHKPAIYRVKQHAS
jgi:hypothetical protein